MDEMNLAVDVMEKVYPMMLMFSPVAFQSLIGCLVDQYAKDHGMTQAETFEIFENLSAVQKQVHNLLGA